MGWMRAQLPNTVGLIGDNMRLYSISELPVLGRGSDSRLALYHQGATVGYFSSIYLFPETESAVIVLTNSIALGDAADWLAQSLVQALFDPLEKNDYVELAQDSKDRMLGKYESLRQDLAKNKIHGTEPNPLSAYAGDYYNAIDVFFIRITPASGSDDTLTMSFQGLAY